MPIVRAFCVVIIQALFALLIAAPPARLVAQQEDRQFALELVNRARIANGVGPVAPNAMLERAAQKRANEFAARGAVDGARADDADAIAAVAEAGYPGWRSGARIAGELAYASKTGFSLATPYFLEQDRLRRVLIERRYREVGIALAVASGPGGPTTYWSLIFGAEPNVLPIYLNDGAAETTDPVLAVRLLQEDVVPEGEGATTVGRIVDVRFSESPQFEGAAWQTWAPLLAFTLQGSPGVRTVYAQFRDGAGRATVSAASIFYDPRGVATAQPVGPGNEVPTLTNPGFRATQTPLPAVTEVVTPTRAPALPIGVITMSPGSVVATPNPPLGVGAAPAPSIPALRPAPSPTPSAGRSATSPPDETMPIVLAAAAAQLAILAMLGRRLMSGRA